LAVFLVGACLWIAVVQAVLTDFARFSCSELGEYTAYYTNVLDEHLPTPEIRVLAE
jgi:hypothetical protein